MKQSFVLELRIGASAPFGPNDSKSAIIKHAVNKPVWLATLGLDGDQQADHQNHGGPDKALHQYCADHYQYWKHDLPNAEISVGMFGENIVANNHDETDTYLGDSFQIGEAIVQVSQPRQPCWKLNVRFDVNGFAKRVQSSGLTGWYYRVLRPGWVASGDLITLRKRPNPLWSLQRVHKTVYLDRFDFEQNSELLAIDELSSAWKVVIQKRLKNRKIESWSSRLQGRV